MMNWIALQVICVLTIALSGCKMAAPIHVWKAPKVDKVGPVRIAVAPIGIASRAHSTAFPLSDELMDAASRLQYAMQATQPHEGASLVAIHANELEKFSEIQLVSFDAQPNDSATVGAAKRAEADYLLQGNVVNARLKQEDLPKRRTLTTMIFGEPKYPEYMVVNWAVTEVDSGVRVADTTISIDLPTAEKRYNDLGYHIPGNDGRVLMASSRAAWEVVASTPVQRDVMIQLPWFWRGSSQVRQGNGYAKQGRWDLAEREWQDVAGKHPTNKAAWHNLALAAVAKEDFELANNRLKHANDWWPGDSTYKTKLWIERRQREYHDVLGMPPPQQGWLFPDSTIATLDDDFRTSVFR